MIKKHKEHQIDYQKRYSPGYVIIETLNKKKEKMLNVERPNYI